MSIVDLQQNATATSDQYRALFAVSDAIASQRDLTALFHELSGRLNRVVSFDALSLVLHDTATGMMRLHVIEHSETLEKPFTMVLSPDDDPAGLVWQTQQPLITSKLSDLRAWPRMLERVQQYGMQSYCWLPLTTARRRLGTLVFTSKQPAMYDHVNVHFLQLVANQVAVAVENAMAFQEIETLKDKLAKEKAYLEEEVRTEHNFGDIVGDNPGLREVLKKVETVAPTDSTVLICGETGTGKELIARAVHNLSPRKGRTFVKLNCAAIPTGLLESELFGHEKGAFTGAIAQKVGRFELANGGTLFLDEVGRHPSGTAIQTAPASCRSRNSSGSAERGRLKSTYGLSRPPTAISRKWSPKKHFRSDLYYRLNVFPLMLPPLARSAGRHSAAGTPLHPTLRTPYAPAHRDCPLLGHGSACALPLAGQCEGVAKCHRAHGDSDERTGATSFHVRLAGCPSQTNVEAAERRADHAQ